MAYWNTRHVRADARPPNAKSLARTSPVEGWEFELTATGVDVVGTVDGEPYRDGVYSHASDASWYYGVQRARRLGAPTPAQAEAMRDA